MNPLSCMLKWLDESPWLQWHPLHAAVMAVGSMCACRRSRSAAASCSACEKRAQRAQSLMSPAGSPSTQRCAATPAQYCIIFSAAVTCHNACNQSCITQCQRRFRGVVLPMPSPSPLMLKLVQVAK